MQDLIRLVHEHHRQLRDWLADGDRDAYDAFLHAHTDDFTLVTVDGAVTDLDGLRTNLAAAGGTASGLQIEVLSAVQLSADVVRFVERHQHDGTVTNRVVTAVIRGGHWLTVHETVVT